MAIYDFSITLRDAYQRKTTRQFKVEDATSFSTALTAAGNFVTDYQALTGCQVLKWSLAQVTDVSDSADAGANLDAGLTITAEIGGIPGKLGSIKVPAPVAAALNPDGTMDLTATVITDFEANFTSGFVLISDQEVVDDFIRGRLDK